MFEILYFNILLHLRKELFSEEKFTEVNYFFYISEKYLCNLFPSKENVINWKRLLNRRKDQKNYSCVIIIKRIHKTKLFKFLNFYIPILLKKELRGKYFPKR